MKKTYSYDYPENREINDQLRNGDQAFIAEKLGYTSKYVSMVLTGTRNNPKIIHLAQEIIKSRNKLKAT